MKLISKRIYFVCRFFLPYECIQKCIHVFRFIPFLPRFFTIHKAQGMSIGKNLVVNIGDKELDHGSTYVALSRVTKFIFIGLKNGISKNRLYKIIA